MGSGLAPLRIAVAALMLFGVAGRPADAAGNGEADSLAAWNQILPVLEHPRCLNCHQADMPLQGDERRLHVPRVQRGADGMGVAGMRCYACHNATGSNETSGTPGAEGWSLAPIETLWQGQSSGDICRQLKDPRRNGGRDGAKLIEHVSTPLVLYGWNPGGDRSKVPVSHDEFVKQLKRWIDGGSACPA